MIPRFRSVCSKPDILINIRKYSSRYSEKPIMRDINDMGEDPSKKKRIPIITTKRKEFNCYVGDKFNKFKPSFVTLGWTKNKSKGDFFKIHPLPDEEQEEKEMDLPPFEDLDFNPQLVRNLEKFGIEKPTLIQLKTFPSILNKFNTLIAAETGSGKTLAYLLPLVQQITEIESKGPETMNRPLALIITPSRELAIQIRRDTMRLVNDMDVKVKAVIGGRTKKVIRNPPVAQVDILIATLGALSKLVTNNIYKLDRIKHVVLDEADSLFDPTFQHQLKYFLSKIQFCYCRETQKGNVTGAQMTLASATMPSNVAPVIQTLIHMDSLKAITTSKLHRVHVPQKFFRVGSSQKAMTLLKFLKEKSQKHTRIIVFVNTSKTAYWLSHFLNEFNVDHIHLSGQMSAYERRGKYGDFKTGIRRILITTDAGSRGLDTIDVRYVVNYDFPLQTAEYIHRCGRTGRVGSPKNCSVINYITRPLEIILAQKLELAARQQKEIPLVDLLQNSKTQEDGSLLEDIQINKEHDHYFEDEEENEEEEMKEKEFPY